VTIQIRRDTAANWTAGNPTPANGQPCWETDAKKLKIGDGATAWNSLAYYGTGGGGGFSYTVSSVAASYSETATSGYKVVKVTASGQTIALPTAVGNTAQFTFKLMVAGTLTIDGAGAQTIDGGLTAVLLSQYEAITIISDNANWQVV
jgi:hypothetical protein